MFTRLVNRAGMPTRALNSSSMTTSLRNHHHRIPRTLYPTMTSTRHQSSSSSSRDNDNGNSTEVKPIAPKEPPVNASFELHQVDLAHCSFFALHRPLLGITNGPMFTSNHQFMDPDDFEGKYPVDDLANYFSRLHPYASNSPSSPLSSSSLITPTATAWASLPPSFAEADQAVDEFLRMIQDKQEQQIYREQLEQEQEAQAKAKAGTMRTSKAEADAAALPMSDPLLESKSVMYLTSVLRKRRIQMRKRNQAQALLKKPSK
ncbi:hypothetical protein EDD11_006573 [Mortierella claussenii]|nr:hypothetical protein EDD11_006573 [Mortierella claussenii]